MKPEIPMKSGFWQDVFTPWRKLYCYLSKPGVTKKAKREYHKAIRQATRRGLWMKRCDGSSEPAKGDEQ